MATTLAVTNTFVAGSAIVAAQVNTNFSDIVTWATTTPNLSVSGSNTTIKGTLTVDEVLIASDGVQLNAASATNQSVAWEGSSVDEFETFLYATNATADRSIYLPNAGGTVALIDGASNILSNSVFN